MIAARILDRCIDTAAAIAGVLLAFQFLSISFDVLLRYFFGISLEWIIYTNEWSLFVIAFLGVAWLQREKGHVRMDLLLTHMNRRLQHCVDIASCMSAMAISMVLMWVGGVRTLELFESGAYDFFKVDYVPLYLIYLVVPIGSLLMFLQSSFDLAAKAGMKPRKDLPM